MQLFQSRNYRSFNSSSWKVSFGSTVSLVDVNTDEEFTYMIVGGVESNAEKGMISLIHH